MKTNRKSGNFFKDIKNETVKSVWAIFFFVLGIFFLLSYGGIAGPAGNSVGIFIRNLFGNVGFALLPAAAFMVGVAFVQSFHRSLSVAKLIVIIIFLISGLGLIDLFSSQSGGLIGKMVVHLFVSFFDIYASFVFLSALMLISLVIIFDMELRLGAPAWLSKIFIRNRKKETQDDDVDAIVEKLQEKQEEEVPEDETEAVADADDTEEQSAAAANIVVKKPAGSESFQVKPILWRGLLGAYTPPPLSLLEKDKGKPGVGDIKANANIIKRTLQNFGISVEMDEVSIGPSVTRYAIKPAEGVKLSKIVALQDNLAYALAAHPIRIEAPIPGKSLVGIEIPNSTKTVVGLATLLGNEEFANSEKPLLMALGKSVSGDSKYGNMAKMPHLLIAGATGSGKSVTIHALIASLLFRNSPENLRFIMIDPKRVELTMYNRIPHLLTPVITEAKKAILSLKWAAKEMDRRYDILESESVRDIESYHKNILAPELKKYAERKKSGEDSETEEKMPELMPYIVVVIDELADIMSAYPRELEAAIVRLAQMSRAVGIHLILSTQRPSVNVITGLIKANVPARIALQVASQVDSRTILDGSGAEKLLGAGDMLYLGGEMSKPLRLQSAFISEGEVKQVVKYLIDNYEELPSDVTITAENADRSTIFEAAIGDEDTEEEDNLYEQAREEVIRAGKASTSYLQRKLRIGYARAARLVDLLEERGVIGPGEGAKPREVIGGAGTPAVDEDTPLTPTP